jgi:hypothetical protein
MRLTSAGVLSLAVLSALPGPAWAKDASSCHLTIGPHDVVNRSGDVTVEPSQVVENAIAFNGTVRVKKGAVVKTAVAVKGDVVVESGGEVTETALSLGGAVRVKKGGAVKGSTLQLKDGSLRIVGESGSVVGGDLVVDGESLSSKLLAGVLGSLEGCAVDRKP